MGQSHHVSQAVLHRGSIGYLNSVVDLLLNSLRTDNPNPSRGQTLNSQDAENFSSPRPWPLATTGLDKSDPDLRQGPNLSPSVRASGELGSTPSSV